MVKKVNFPKNKKGRFEGHAHAWEVGIWFMRIRMTPELDTLAPKI